MNRDHDSPLAICVHLRPLLILTVSLACTEQRPAPRDASDTARLTTAAPDSQVQWAVRPIPDAPRYFTVSGWVDQGHVWGLAGENPVDVDVLTGAAEAWGVRAAGAHRSRDGGALAWGNATGIWVIRRGSPARRILTYASMPSRPAGDPTNEVLWAPNGRRLLTSWRDEGAVTHVLVDTANGAFESIATRLSGYGEAFAPIWIDDRRILFATAAIRSRDGSTEYREAGWRSDLAVHDLGTHSHEKVTDAPDGVFLRAPGRFGDTVVVQRRRIGEDLSSFSFFDTHQWAEQPSDLPRGTIIVVSSDGSRAAIFRSDDRLSEVIIRSRRAGAPHAAPVLIPGRITGAAWSPSGTRLAVSTMAEDGVPGTAGDVVMKYRLVVVEPAR